MSGIEGACSKLTDIATAGVAPALRAVDCLAGELTASTFGRIFGSHGAMMPVLTILLTLYIAFFAISLLTGRSALGVSALTPRMMTLGLVLTFATSWVAYQTVVWNLAVAAPDWIAGVLTGTKGSATQIFGDKIDLVFAAISETAKDAGAQAVGGEPPADAPATAASVAAAGTFSPDNLMWLAALLFMLSTVGLLVTARIALAVLMALGPIFVVLALFSGTRGLFAGWLRGVVFTGITPLFAVLSGSFMLELMVPVIAGLKGLDGIDAKAVMALFLLASVHMALMYMVLNVVGKMVADWTVFGLASSKEEKAARKSSASDAALLAAAAAQGSGTAPAAEGRRTPAVVAHAAMAANSDAPASDRRTHVTHITGAGVMAGPASASPADHGAPARARGIGSRFRSANDASGTGARQFKDTTR